MFLLDSTDLSLMRLAVSISRLKKTYFISFFAVFIGASTQTFASNEVPQSFTLDGQLSTLTGDQPLLDNHAKITVQILDPSKTCLLYEESQFVDTTISNGYYSVQIGSVLGSAKRTSNDPGRTMQEIFQNRNSINASNSSSGVCGGGAYFPSPGASRYFRLIVTPSATNVADTLLPDTIMDSVPYSLVAESVQGLTPNNLLQVKTTGGTALSQANLENIFSSANHVNLLALLAIPAANVLATPANGGAALPSYAGNPSSPAAGHIWYDSGSNVMKYYDGAIKTIGTSSGLSSVGLSMPGIFSVSGSPLTANGSITTTLANQSTNTVFAGPASGGAAAPTFRSLASTDLPLTGASGMYANGGNSFGVAGSLGTNDAYDLNFKTNNTTKMTILSNGSVGIGTATPTTMLSVAANTTLQTPNTGSLLQLTGANNSSGALTIDTFGNTNWSAPYLTLRRSYGTSAAPSYPLLYNIFGELQMLGWDGGPYSPAAQISAEATENWSATARGTRLMFSVGTRGAASSTLALTINSDGASLFAGGYPASRLHIGGSKSGGSWTTSGALINVDPGTLTDTTGSGVIATRVANSIGIPTMASTNAETITNAATFYVAGPPSPGANTVLTNPSAFYVATGNSFFGGNVGIGTTTPTKKLVVQDESSVQIALVNNNGSANQANNTEIARIDFNPRFNGINISEVSRISAYYQGDGTTRSGDLRFSTGNSSAASERMRITPAGRVGMGRPDPSHPLDVVGSINVDSYASNVGTISNSLVFANSGEGIGSKRNAGGNQAGLDFYTASANRMSITNAGNVGIGTTGPGAKLDITDAGTTTSAIIVPRAGNFTGTNVNGMIRYNTSSTLFEFYQNGAWVNYTAVSDGRLKTNVVPVTEALGIVNQLNPVFYDWDRSHPKASGFEDKHQVGFIAQEVEKVLPEVVNKGEDSYRSLEYGKIVSVVVAAVKELYSKVLGIDRELASVKADKTEVDAKVQKLEYDNAAKDKKIKELEQRLENIEKALSSK
jgi:hypothetical protein